jgi:serine/threonine protein kinase
MNDTPDATEPRSDGAPSLVALLIEQRQSWQRGQRTLVESYLQRHPALAADADALLDLIGNELLLRHEQAETPQLEDYLARFPQLAPQIKIQFEVERAIESAAPAHTLHAPSSIRSTLPLPPFVAAGSPLSIPGYEILGVLGRGAMGVVYKARQVGLNRLVALKMILAGEAADPEQRARFRHEAEAVAHLQHPNIVHIYDVGEHQGQPYFALEFVAGGTLAKKLAGAPLPAREAAQVVETLAQAMHHAHLHGIVHRDLKPANVLIAGSGQPAASSTEPSLPAALKISDFGLAKRLHGEPGLTRTGHIMGTPSYMAPEQAAGKNREVGPATDVYALGATLYEMLTGRPPFRGETDLETLHSVLGAAPLAPSRLQRTVPRDLETICMKCLRKETHERYASAAALAEDLQRFLAGQSVRARPDGKAAQLWRWCRRNRALAAVSCLAAAAMLLIAVLVGLEIYLHYSRPDDSATPFEAKLDQRGEMESRAARANVVRFPFQPLPGDNIEKVGKQPTDKKPLEKKGDQIVSRPNGPLFFKDDFDGPNPNAQPLFPDQLMTWVSANGSGRLTATCQGILPVMYTEHKLADFFVDFEILITRDNLEASFGVLFRCDRDDKVLPNYYALIFFPNTGEAMVACFQHNKQWTLIKKHACKIELDKDVPVRLEVVGQQFRVFVDKTFQFEATDALLSAPGLLCLTINGSNNAAHTVVFKKLRVYQPGD